MDQADSTIAGQMAEQAAETDKAAAAEYAKVAYASHKLDKWLPAPARAAVLRLIETVFTAGVRWERAVWQGALEQAAAKLAAEATQQAVPKEDSPRG
jgi:hypothetical protein